MVRDETIILLIHYYESEEYEHRLLKDIIRKYCGIYLPYDLYLYEPLQKTFAKVIVYDYLKRRGEIGVKATNEEIVSLVIKKHAKYVLWASWQYDIQESTFERIRQEGSIVIGWFFDDEWRFDNYSKWWIPYLDYCVTGDIEAVARYRELGASAIHTICNTGIAVDVDWSNIRARYDVSFVGSKGVVDREQYVNELQKRGIPIHLFGGGWGEYISFEKMIEVFKTSKINLNFSRAYMMRRFGIKGRIFQVCMAGGFMLTEYAPGIENYFEIDKEIVCFNDADEMSDKITYYLAHEAERQVIAQRGWERATREYTSCRVVSKVFNQIEEEAAARNGRDRPYLCRPKMPIWIRMIPSQYNFYWGRMLMEKGYEEGLWRDSLALSLLQNPFNIWVRYYCMVGFIPSFMRPVFFKPYSWMEKLAGLLRDKLNSMPRLKKMMRRGFVEKVILRLKP